MGLLAAITAPPRTRTPSARCVAAILLIVTAKLTGCATASSEPRASLQIYQPRVLRLSAGRAVETRDGTYRPQVDETWHSAAAYEALETQLINTAAALAQERARSLSR